MDNSFYVTLMQQKDLDDIMEIEASSFTDAWTKAGFEESLNQPYAKMYTARMADTVVGYCCMYHFFDEGEIINVAIHPNWRQRGLGSRMLKHLIEEGMQMGVKRFVLDVRESNVSAQKLYESAGFKKIVLQKRFYDTPVEDGWLMEYLV